MDYIITFVRRLLLSGLVFYIVCVAITKAFEPVKCLKDPDLKDYPVNVYYCENEEKPECCEVNKEFSCCTTDVEKNATEQIQLWGLVGLVLVIGAFILVCWRKDTYLCEGDNIKDRCSRCCSCCGGKKKEPTEDPDDFHRYSDVNNGNYTSKPYTPYTSTSGMTTRNLHPTASTPPATARHVNPTMASTFDPYDPDCQVHKSGRGLGDEGFGEEDSGRGSVLSLDEFGGTSAKERMNAGEGKNNLSYV